MRIHKWEALPPMEDALTDPPAAAHGQYIYVMGGLLGILSSNYLFICILVYCY